jgi:hypothetical protein
VLPTAEGPVKRPLSFVGWLDVNHPYDRGAVSADVVGRLFELTTTRRKLTRAGHPCTFCIADGRHDFARMTLHGTTIDVGFGEVTLAGEGETTYLFPDLICHYVLSHGYRPPDEFLDAVMAAALSSDR